MPELPDVEIFRQYFQSTALHQKISDVQVRELGMLEGISANRLKDSLAGRSFDSAHRHGKFLFAETDAGSLVLHFGMTGFLRYYKGTGRAPEHIRLEVTFTNGYRLAYDCRRKLGKIGWTDDRQQFIAEKELGPDPIGDAFDSQFFCQLQELRRGSIKGLLMNQQVLAGIGNIYSDEILFQAGIRPDRKIGDLQQQERENLFDCLMEVLRTAIERRVGEKGWPENWLLPHRRPGETCPICGGQIERVKASGRSAYLCSDHQQ